MKVELTEKQGKQLLSLLMTVSGQVGYRSTVMAGTPEGRALDATYESWLRITLKVAASMGTPERPLEGGNPDPCVHVDRFLAVTRGQEVGD